MALVAIAGGVTLVLGLVGIYGVNSYIVSQRTGEIGVRLALGADPRAVSEMILTQGGRVVIAGAAVGSPPRQPEAASSSRCSTASARALRVCSSRPPSCSSGLACWRAGFPPGARRVSAPSKRCVRSRVRLQADLLGRLGLGALGRSRARIRCLAQTCAVLLSGSGHFPHELPAMRVDRSCRREPMLDLSSIAD